MAKAQNITEMAFQITADASGFIGEMTRTATAFEKTVQGITKSQQELGASRGDDGILLNSLNQNVEGLKNWQIALGYSRDATGQLLNKNKQLVEGLKAVQQKMGMYKDDLGNVYNAQGQLIRQGAEAIAKEKEKAKAIEDAAKAREAESRALERAIALDAEKQAKAVADANRAVEESLKGIGDTLKFSTNMLVTFSSGGGESAKRLKVLSAAMASFTSTAQMIPMISRWYKSMTVVTNLQTGAIQRQTAAQGLLNIVSGNWLTIVGSLAAAGLTFTVVSQIEQTGKEADIARQRVENLTDAVRRMNDGSFRVVSGAINSIDSANYIREQNSKDRKILDENFRSLKFHEELIRKNMTYGNWWSGLMSAESRRLRENAKLSQEFLSKLKTDTAEIRKQVKEREQELQRAQISTLGSALGIFDSEYDRIRQQIEFIQNAIDTEGIDAEAGRQGIANLQKRDYELRIKPLEAYMTEVEKASKSFAWLNDINDKKIKQSRQYQRALEERTKQMERAYLLDEMGEEKFKLYDQIQSYVSPWQKFGETAQNLTDLLEKQEVSLEGWIDASKKNEEALLGSLKYGSYIKKAQEGLLSVDDKIHEAFAEIERAGKEMQLTRDVIEAAKLEAEKDLRDSSKKREQEVRTDLEAAERGSMEAYRIIGNAQQDRQVKAIKDQTARLIAANREDTTMVVQAFENNSLSDVGIMDG